MAKKKIEGQDTIDYKSLLQQLKKKDYKPIYLLDGEEIFFSHRIDNYIVEHALPKEAQSFNQFILYGKDTTDGAVVDTASRVPMMGDRSLVVLREMQELSSLAALADYCEHPNPETILVMSCNKTLSGGTGKNSPIKRLIAGVEKNGVHLHSPKLRMSEVSPWINTLFKEEGLGISPEANQFIVDQKGTNLTAIANDIKKIRTGLPEGKTLVNLEDVADAIGVSREFNVFELTKAIGAGNYFKANQIAMHMSRNPKNNDIIFVTGQIHSFFTKVFLYGVLSKNTPQKEIASRIRVSATFLREYDMAARIYPPGRCARIFSILRMLDMRNKGMGGASLTLEEALKDTVLRIMR